MKKVFSFSNPELEGELSQLAEDGKSYAVELGKDNATQNVPTQKSPMKPFFGSIKSFFSPGIGKIRSMLKSALGKSDLEAAKTDLDNKKDIAAKELVEVENQIRLKLREKQKSEEKGNAPVKKMQRWKRLRVFNFFVIFLDILLSAQAFQQMGYNWIPSLGIGIGLGISIYLISENFPEIIARGKTRPQRIAIIVSVFVALTIVFFVIGVFRSNGLSSSSGSGTSPWHFTILNLFFFSTASAVVLLNKPNRAERKQLDAWFSLLDELKEQEARKAKIQGDVDRAQLVYNEKREAYEKVWYYAQDLEQLVVNYYEDAIQAYITTNVQFRSDGVIPDGFSENPPALDLHFTNQNPNI